MAVESPTKLAAVLSPVHTSNNVEATFVECYKSNNSFDKVECCFDIAAVFGNKISSFRQSRNKLNMFNLFRLCRNDEISFDTVAAFGNEVECCFDRVERLRHCCSCGHGFSRRRRYSRLSVRPAESHCRCRCNAM